MIICSPQLGLNPRSVLGGEVFDREILLGFAKRGIKVIIIMPKNSPHDLNVKNWQVIEMPVAHFPAILFNIFLIPYLFTIGRKNEIDILRLHQPQYTGFAAIIIKIFNPNVKILATYHKFEETKFGLFSSLINRYWDYIVCDSNAVKESIIERYQIQKKKILVVHNGVPKYLKPQKKDVMLVKKYKLENKIVLLFMGLFINRKNPLFLIDVLKILVDKNSKVKLLFWGKGSLKEAIIKKAKQLKLSDYVTFIEPIFGPKKKLIHNVADIFLHPSLDEGLALAPLEAMACAKPVIITDGYSASEVVKLNGFRCKENDVKAWSQSIIKLIKNPKLRLSMGKKSQEVMQTEFSWNVSVEKHIKFLKSIK